MKKSDSQPPTPFVAGPSIRPTGALRTWLATQASMEAARHFKLPVVVRLDPSRLGIKDAFIGVAGAPGDDGLMLKLDDSALGISLMTHVRDTCSKDADTCALWLEGRWGTLLETRPPGADDKGPWAFSVMKVHDAIDPPQDANVQDVTVFVSPAGS